MRSGLIEAAATVTYESTFTINIEACAMTSFTVPQSVISSQTYNIGDPAHTVNWPPVVTSGTSGWLKAPSCSYSVTFFLGTVVAGTCTDTPYVAPAGITVTFDQTQASITSNDVSVATPGVPMCMNARVNDRFFPMPASTQPTTNPPYATADGKLGAC